MAVGVRHREVARQQVEQGRDVAGALDAGVPAQRLDAAAGPADVAEQQLQHARRADVLRADGVLGPADGVGEGGGAVAAGVGESARRTTWRNSVSRDAADLLDHLGGVAGVVPLEHLEDAARVLQGLVAVRLAVADARAARAVRLAAAGVLAPTVRSLCRSVSSVSSAGAAAPTAPFSSTPSYCQVFMS